MPGIFVSHSTADSRFVDAFVDTLLRLGCEVPPGSVFYSSGADTGVPGGADLGAYIRDRVGEGALVIALITPTFASRPYCVAELGAAWGRADGLLPLLAAGVSRDDLDGVLTGMMVRNVGDEAALDELHDRVGRALGVHSKAATWNRYKEKWLDELPRHLDGIAAAPAGVVSLASCSRDHDHMEVFWTDHASDVWFRWWEADSGWSKVERMDDVKADYLAAVSADGLEMLFGVQGTGQVWCRPWVVTQRGWNVAGDQAWIPGEVIGPLTALSRGWAVELAAWTPSGKPCHLWREGDGWTDWTTEWK